MKKIRRNKLTHHWLGNYILNSFLQLTSKGYNTFLFHRWGVFEYLCSLALHYLKNHRVAIPWSYGVLNFQKLESKFHDPMPYLSEVTYFDQDQMNSSDDDVFRHLLSNASLLLVCNDENDPETARLIEIAKESGIKIVDMIEFNRTYS